MCNKKSKEWSQGGTPYNLSATVYSLQSVSYSLQSTICRLQFTVCSFCKNNHFGGPCGMGKGGVGEALANGEWMARTFHTVAPRTGPTSTIKQFWGYLRTIFGTKMP